MQVTFLGTSSGVPTRARNVSAVALRLPQRSEMWLFDCGEGTQHQFLRSDLRLSQLRRVFITHMHGDHVFGLPGLLASLGLAGSCAAGVDLYGPDPLESYLNGVLRTSSTRIGYPTCSQSKEELQLAYPLKMANATYFQIQGATLPTLRTSLLAGRG